MAKINIRHPDGKLSAALILCLVFPCWTSRALGQVQHHTLMGHHLGENYKEALDIVKATKGMSIEEAGGCVAATDPSLDQPNECTAGLNLSDAISVRGDNRAAAFVNFDFISGKLIRISTSGCAAGISQVRLLEKKFGKYSEARDMPFRNTTGSLNWDKEWDWKLSSTEHLYVLEGIDSECGGTDVAVVFERPTKEKVVNPY